MKPNNLLTIFFTAILLCGFSLTSCTKDDEPNYIVIDPNAGSNSNSNNDSSTSYTESTDIANGGSTSATSGENQPEGAIPYYLEEGYNISIEHHGRQFSLRLNKPYNLGFYDGYDENGNYLGGKICTVGKVSGLSGIDTSSIPTYGWTTNIACNVGYGYIVNHGEMYVALFVSSITSYGALIWYCPFSTTGGYNH